MDKWKPFPTRENIFINQDDGFMYEKGPTKMIGKIER